MFHALNCLLQRGAHQISLYYSFKTLSVTYSFLLLCQLITYLDDDGDDEGLSWSSPASSWWPVVVYEWFTGLCIRVQPRTALTALKWSRQVHGILSWKHFFTDVIIPPVSSSNHPRCVGNGVVQWSRTKPFSSLWMLSFVCAARVPSCIQSDKALKYFRMTVYFVKVSLRRILTGCNWVSFYAPSQLDEWCLLSLFFWSCCIVLMRCFLCPIHIWLSGDMDRKNKPAITLKNTVHALF